MVYSTALVYLSTWAVVTIAPQAAGAGVAEVTAYLNGCNLPKVSTVRFFGTIAASLLFTSWILTALGHLYNLLGLG